MTIQQKHLLYIGLPVLALLFLGNHLEYALRAARLARPQIAVRAESNALGHRSIGIDEAHMTGAAGTRMLFFSTLANWAYAANHATPCPPTIQGLSGQAVSCVGFMYPLEAGSKIKEFCLLRSTQTCCYGPRPQYNQYLLVECRAPVSFERFTPIIVQGRFVVDPQPDQGFIYRMEATSVERAADEGPEINAADAARKARLPLLSYAPLAEMAGGKSTAIPAALQALDGKTAVLDGYCVGRTKGTPERVIVGKAWWDGVASGTPPTIYTAVMVTPRDAQHAPPLWQTHVVMTGTVHITRDADAWPKDGIVSLRDASVGVPASGWLFGRGGGPVLPVSAEIALTLILLLLTVRRKRRATPVARKLTEEGEHDHA